MDECKKKDKDLIFFLLSKKESKELTDFVKLKKNYEYQEDSNGIVIYSDKTKIRVAYGEYVVFDGEDFTPYTAENFNATFEVKKV